MPRRDGTGPMTGRVLGVCTGSNAVKYGTGLGMGLGLGLARRCGLAGGFGRGLGAKQTFSKTQKELLNEQKIMLQDRLQAIDKQLDDL